MKPEKRIIPERLRNIERWRLSRRKMLKELLAIGVLSQLPFAYSCVSESEKRHLNIFDGKQKKMVLNIQQVLFPDDGFGPGAVEIKADKYLEWILADARMDIEDKDYIYKGLKWVDESANEVFDKDYLKLDGQNQQQLIRKVSRTDWGESWLAIIVTYIVEALLADPQYGGNTNGKGWKWLSHDPGYPRPTYNLLYPAIFDTLKKENEKI